MLDSLDLRSIALSTGIVAVVMGFCMVYFNTRGKTYPGFNYWIASCFLSGTGFILISARGFLPEFMTIIVANFCVVATLIAMSDGIDRFNGTQIQHRPFKLTLLSLMMLCFLYFTYVMPHVNMRIIIISVVLAVMLATIYLGSVRNLKETFPDLGRVLKLVLIANCVWFGARALFTAFFEQFTRDFLTAGPVHQASFIILVLMNIVLAVSVIIATAERWRAELVVTNEKLTQTLDEVKVLRDIIPICASCKSVRNDSGYYEAVDHYLTRHSEMLFSHTLCPDCIGKIYPDLDGGNQT